MAQKVISVSVSLNKFGNGYIEYEFEKLNKYLDEGYIIYDKIHSVSDAEPSTAANITFILTK